jgi:hypothetical protein
MRQRETPPATVGAAWIIVAAAGAIPAAHLGMPEVTLDHWIRTCGRFRLPPRILAHQIGALSAKMIFIRSDHHPRPERHHRHLHAMLPTYSRNRPRSTVRRLPKDHAVAALHAYATRINGPASTTPL